MNLMKGWISHVNTKRTTGIPMDELMETTKDDPLAMLHPSGKFVKSIMHFQARLQRKHEPFPGQANDSTGSPCDDEQKSEVPDQYKCFLCKGILRDAVLAACCGHSFCAECYQQQLLANPVERCPGPECSQQISADSLIPNKSLRSAIQKYLNEFKTCSETTEQHQSGGVNKPSVLTDTQSLLHKLMPDLAYAQAQRELATTATTTTAAAVHSSPPQQEITQSFTPLPSQSISVNNPPIAASTTTAIHDANLFLQPKIPIFDPKRPPPPINLPPIYASQNYPITPPNIIPSSGLLTPEKGSITQVTSSINSVQPKGLVSASPLSAQGLISVWEKFLERKDNERRKNNSSIITADKVSISHVTTSINSTTTHQQKNVSPLSSQELSSVWEKFLERKDNERGTNVISSSSFTKVEKGSVAQVTNTSTNNGVQQKSERKHVSSPSTKELSPVRGKDKQEKKKSKKRKKERKDEKEDDEKKRKKKKQDGNDNEEEKKKKNKSEDGKDDEEKKKKNKKDEENGDEEKKKKKEEGTDNEEKKKKKEDGKEEEKKMKNKSEGEKENDEKKKKKKREHEKDGEEKKKKKKEKGGKKKEKAEKKEKERGRKDKRRKEKKEDKEKDRKTRKRKKEEKRDHHHEGKERGGRKRNEREERTTKEEKKSN